MATIKAAPKMNLSGLKRDRQSEKRRLRNQSVQSKVRTSTKKLEAAEEGAKYQEEDGTDDDQPTSLSNSLTKLAFQQSAQ